MADRFPVTLWPSVHAPEQPVSLSTPHWFDEGVVEWLPTSEEPRLLPAELVIRELLEVDTADEDDVVDFVAEHGWVIGGGNRVADYDYDALPKRGPNGFAVTPIIELAATLELTSRLAQSWLAWTQDDFIAPLWFAPSPVLSLDTWPNETEDEARSRLSKLSKKERERVAWHGFAQDINYGLTSFAINAQFERDARPSRYGETDLFSALCLQLYNLIVDGLPPKTCMREACSRWFVRQRGGAQHGQYRTSGVMFCSPACAQAQKQREYRLRKKEQQR